MKGIGFAIGIFLIFAAFALLLFGTVWFGLEDCSKACNEAYRERGITQADLWEKAFHGESMVVQEDSFFVEYCQCMEHGHIRHEVKK